MVKARLTPEQREAKFDPSSPKFNFHRPVPGSPEDADILATERLVPGGTPVRRVVAKGGCWPWLGAITDKGYGAYKDDDNTTQYVHIHMCENSLGRKVGEGFEVDHLCHTQDCRFPVCNVRGCFQEGHCHHPRCGRPEHLKEKPHKDNVKRSTAGVALHEEKVERDAKASSLKERMAKEAREWYDLPADERACRLDAVGKRLTDALPLDRQREIEAQKIFEKDSGWSGGIARPDGYHHRPLPDDGAEMFACPPLFPNLRFNPYGDEPPREGSWYPTPNDTQGLSHYKYYGPVPWSDRRGWHDIDIVSGVMQRYTDGSRPMSRIAPLAEFPSEEEDSMFGRVWKTIFPKALPGETTKEEVPLVDAEVVTVDATVIDEAKPVGKKWWRR